MPVRITGRKLAVTDEVRRYIEKKIPRIEKYADRIQILDMFLEKDAYQHCAEIHVKAGPVDVKATTRDPNLLRAVDLLIDKVESQMRKKWEKVRGQTKEKSKAAAAKRQDAFEEEPPAKTRKSRKGAAQSTGPVPDEAAAAKTADDRTLPLGVEKLGVKVFPAESVNIPVMAISEAAEDLYFRDENFLLFVNEESGRWTIMFRRKDGNFGTIEPS